jgi:hypothetical protein
MMTREDIIRMAREAGFETDCGPLLPESASIKVGGLYVGLQPLIERFAALVAGAEREAMVAEAAKQGWAMRNEDAFEDAVREIAAIRARGEQ